MLMWYAIYALLQATLAIVLQFVPYAPLKRFYWQAIIQVAAFLPIGLLWILNLLFSNSLINKMIDTALSLSLVSPFIVHWVGLGMLTIDLVWEDWLSVVFWTMYIVWRGRNIHGNDLKPANLRVLGESRIPQGNNNYRLRDVNKRRRWGSGR